MYMPCCTCTVGDGLISLPKLKDRLWPRKLWFLIHSYIIVHATLELTNACVSLHHCRVHVTCLYSVIQFIQDFAGSVLNSEEYGYLLTQLKVMAIV